jgi:hypothetical protein
MLYVWNADVKSVTDVASTKMASGVAIAMAMAIS